MALIGYTGHPMLESALVNRFDLSGSADLVSKLRKLVYQRQVLFFHVPKCGGTSLSHALRLRYLASSFKLREEICSQIVPREDVDRWMESKRNMFLYQAISGTNFVQGHVTYEHKAFARFHGRATFVTMLREPVDRLISHYFFDIRARKLPFDDYLASNIGRFHSSVYCRFFGGLPMSERRPTTPHRDAAIEALKRFDIVGLLEKPGALACRLRTKLGMNLALPTRNVGMARRAGDRKITAEQRKKAAELCRFDTEIYETFSRRIP